MFVTGIGAGHLDVAIATTVFSGIIWMIVMKSNFPLKLEHLRTGGLALASHPLVLWLVNVRSVL